MFTLFYGKYNKEINDKLWSGNSAAGIFRKFTENIF